VPERSLDEVQVACLLVEPGGEGVPEGVDRDRPVDCRFLEPIGEPQLDLPRSQPVARIAPKKRRVGATVALCAVFLEVAAQEPPKLHNDVHWVSDNGHLYAVLQFAL